MFIPNTTCLLIKEGQKDRYGVRAEGSSSIARMAIVKLELGMKKTTVRADSSASRGTSDEEVSSAVFLFEKTSSVAVGDFIEIYNHKLKVVSCFPRYDVVGKFDHIQVEAQAWV